MNLKWKKRKTQVWGLVSLVHAGYLVTGFPYSLQTGWSPEEGATIHTIFPPLISPLQKCRADIRYTWCKWPLHLSWLLETNSPTYTKRRSYALNQMCCDYVTGNRCFNEFLVNENHTHISRKLHGQVGDFFLGAFQLSFQLADLLWTKKRTAAALLNNSTNITAIIIMQEQKGVQKSCFLNRTRAHKQNLNAITH